MCLYKGRLVKSLVFFVPIQESFAFLSIRQNLIRIPEVLIRLKEAEQFINELQSEFKGSVDLISIMQSNWNKESSFISQKTDIQPRAITNISSNVVTLRKKLSLIVSYASQIGLFDRYIKSFSYPEFLMYSSLSDKAVLVAVKHCSMKKMIQSVLEEELPKEDKKTSISYVIFKRDSSQYQECERIFGSNFKPSFEQFTLKKNLKAFIHLGPGQSLPISFSDLSASQFTELESISMDPLLYWFWSDVRLPIFDTEASIAI